MLKTSDRSDKVFTLNTLVAPRCHKNRIRAGRGNSARRGNTAGRGNNGQNARPGKGHYPNWHLKLPRNKGFRSITKCKTISFSTDALIQRLERLQDGEKRFDCFSMLKNMSRKLIKSVRVICGFKPFPKGFVVKASYFTPGALKLINDGGSETDQERDIKK